MKTIADFLACAAASLIIFTCVYSLSMLAFIMIFSVLMCSTCAALAGFLYGLHAGTKRLPAKRERHYHIHIDEHEEPAAQYYPAYPKE
jgi:dolichol kinase